MMVLVVRKQARHSSGLCKETYRVYAYTHATGVETLLCLPASCCRAKTPHERTSSGSVHARQSKAALSALCPHQKSLPRPGFALRCSVSALKHIQAHWMWGLRKHLCSSRQAGMWFHFGGRGSLCLMCSWCPELLVVDQLNHALHPATKTYALLLFPCFLS